MCEKDCYFSMSFLKNIQILFGEGEETNEYKN